MKSNLLAFFGAAMAFGALHCSAPTGDGAQAQSPVIDDDGIELSTIPHNGLHCWAQIERPIPADPVLALGTSITLKTGGAICPQGLDEKVAYRYYVEKVDRNGNIIAPRVSPQGPTEWSLTKSTFDTNNLPGPGRYRIYGFSLPRTMIAAWQANDPVARNTSLRTGNAYTEFVTTSWSTGDYGSCSASCGGGVQTRAVVCKDNNGVTRADSWCASPKPSSSQACNESACAPAQTPNSITLGGFEDFMLVNSSSPGTEMMPGAPNCFFDPMMMMMECFPGPPMPYPVYRVSGSWQDVETSARVDVQITFSSMPSVEGDYVAAGNSMPPPGQAYVVIWREIPGTGSYTYSSVSGNALVKVRFGSDNQLHVLLDDPAFGSGNVITAVKADLAVAPQP